jgi:uncharacterized protein (DUF427 family)/acyl-CoA thioesterase
VSDIRSAWPDHPGYRIDIVPCRGTARVSLDGTVLAESTSALRVIETDHVERLYFPEADVRLDALKQSDHHTVCPFKGRASYWSAPSVDNLFWFYPDPFAEVAEIRGHLGIYHDKATVEVESGWPDGGRSVNRFPVWGDQDDLLAVLDAQPAGPGRFTAPGYHERSRNVVEGGQLLGQAVVAAARTVPDQRVTWASMTFPRAASFDGPIELAVEELRRGRTFSTLSVRSAQGGKLVAPATVLMDTGSPDVIRSAAAMPDVGGPADAQPYDMRVTGRDLRIVDGAYDPDPDRVGPPVIHAWVRFRDNPGERYLRQALVAQATTHWTIAAGMRPHAGFGEAQAHVTLSTGPMAIALAFHDDAPVDGWLLYTTSAIWSGQGLVQGEGKVFTREGVLVASYTLQAMVRGLIAGAQGRDASTAM